MAAKPGGVRSSSSRDGSPTPWALAGLGFQWFVAVLAFVYAGNWVDRRLGSAPIALLVGVFVGGGGVFYVGVRRVLGTGSRESGTPSASPSPRQSEHRRHDD